MREKLVTLKTEARIRASLDRERLSIRLPRTLLAAVGLQESASKALRLLILRVSFGEVQLLKLVDHPHIAPWREQCHHKTTNRCRGYSKSQYTGRGCRGIHEAGTNIVNCKRLCAPPRQTAD